MGWRNVKLQWGRARASAEMTPAGALGSGTSLTLQWGRARASAEMNRYRLTRCGLCGCFNGAALVRARKSCGPEARRRRETRFNGAALVRARKSGDPSSAGNGRSSLQWGRARASAEMAETGKCLRKPHPGFNGAALVRARKCIAAERERFRLAVASMGPRSCERGNPGRGNEIV